MPAGAAANKTKVLVRDNITTFIQQDRDNVNRHYRDNFGRGRASCRPISLKNTPNLEGRLP